MNRSISMSTEKFNKLLLTQKIPYYAQIKFPPEKLFEYYRAMPITVTRKKHVVRVSALLQRKIYTMLCKSSAIEPFVIGISSIPTDYLGLQVASLINYSLTERFRNLEWLWINSNIRVEDINPVITPNLIVLYNIIPQCERIYRIRDILTKFPKALRLVIIGGTNAIDYFDNFLHYPLSGMIHIGGTNNIISRKYIHPIKVEEEEPVFTQDIEKFITPFTKKVSIFKES